MKRLYDYLAPRVVENIEEAAIRMRRNLRAMTHSFRDDESDPAKSVFLCGTMRSGTTWLAEVLNYANDYRLLYEPFNPNSVPLCKYFWERQYLRPDNADAKYLKPACAIFSGKIRNPWVDQYNQCKNVHRRLIKEVRSTLMLKWILKHFPQTPTIFLMRNPCAVAISRCKVGFETDLRERVFFKQKTLVADYLAQFATKISRANSPFERHVVDWCIEHYVPFAQLEQGDVYLAFYEDLVANPNKELPPLFAFLNRPFDKSILEHLHKPSASSRKKGDVSAVLSGDSIIDGWRKHISVEQLVAARKIMELFGLDHIYGNCSLPDAQEAGKLIGQVSAARV